MTAHRVHVFHRVSVPGDETEGGNKKTGTATDSTPPTRTAAPDPDSEPDGPIQSREWRLRYTVGDITHYTAWTADFAALENLYEQYRREGYGSNHILERREVLR